MMSVATPVDQTQKPEADQIPSPQEKEREREREKEIEIEIESTSTETSSNSNSNDEVHLFKSRLADIEISNNIPLHTYCFQKLSEFSHRPCLISAVTGKIYTFADTHTLCRKTAAGLSSLGVSKGDVIMILLPNCEEFVFSFMAASFLGAAVTTANPFYTSGEIAKQLKASKAKVVVTQREQVGKVGEAAGMETDLGGCEGDADKGERETVMVRLGEAARCVSFWGVVEREEGGFEEVEMEAESAVALPFSSGTTGLAKGVVLSHKSLITSVAQQVDGENPNLYLSGEDVVVCVLPLFHIFSLNSVLLCALRAGAAVVLVPRFEIGSLLRVIEKYGVTVAAVVPPLVVVLAKNPCVGDYDLSSIRVVLSGAAPLGKELQEALRARLPQATVGQGYGMTEAGPVVSMCMSFAKHPSPTKPGSCGTVVRNAHLKLIHPQTGRSLGYNQPGEICIRGDQIMTAYLNDPSATASTIDSHGFLHTGDIGYIDHDDELFIVDRLKELIKFKGFQVPPAELEALLLSHPHIADAAAVPQTHPLAGEVPVAFVVLSAGAHLTEDAVKDFISKQVVFYKRLHNDYFVDSIPKSPSGKILRKLLRAKLASPSPST